MNYDYVGSHHDMLFSRLIPPDQVIIGGGTAGLVVSSRLAQRGEKVLVLESGGECVASLYLNTSHATQQSASRQ